MQKATFSFIIVLTVFVLFSRLIPGNTEPENLKVKPELEWNTFLGDTSFSYSITTDSSGNIYVTGESWETWGSPLRPFAKESDGFVAKLDPDGTLLWNTFLGGNSLDSAHGIAIDDSGNIYVTGYSYASWGSPKKSFTGDSDAFAAKLNSNGKLQWNTFMGGSGLDMGNAVTTDSNGNIYIAGDSYSSWGQPVKAFDGYCDAFAAKLNPDGTRLWNTFTGGGDEASGMDIETDKNGDVYLTGDTTTTWGNPVNAFTGENDAYVLKLNSNGARKWNTFLGGLDFDSCSGLALDKSGNIYITGASWDTWGSPVRPFGKSLDAFAAMLNSNGTPQWNTFLGGKENDSAYGITASESGHIYVTGQSYKTWGKPVIPFAGSSDAFTASLNSSGALEWHTFLGGSDWDSGTEVVTDGSGTVYATGTSFASWGTPVTSFPGYNAAFVARIKDADAQTPYNIALNRENLYFGAAGNVSTNSQAIMVGSDISNSNVPEWSITCDQTWFTCNPADGTGPGPVDVSVNPTGLAAGTYNGIITVTDPNALNSSQTVDVTMTVYSPGQTTEPFGQYSTPEEGSTVFGSVPFTGWVLDDTGVASVGIYLLDGRNSTFIGDAVFIEGARPDVEEAFPGFPLNYRAGWGYMMLTNFLPNGGNGVFTLAAVAEDMEGNRVTLGTKTITVDNANAVKPFGAIDTPAQNGTASGSSYRNSGWVLTPPPNSIPTDGTTISVWVDGVNKGHPVYNINRSDVAALFPGYANTDGAGGYINFDTTTYANGVHTIFWTAADNGGNEEGIGSRYFLIQNTGSSRAAAANSGLTDIPPSYGEPVELKKGYGVDDPPLRVFPDAGGIVHIRCRELERIELQVSGAGTKVEGFMPVGQRCDRLPIGSTLDRTTGTFAWIPGPGFVGTYGLVFVVTDEKGARFRKDILITILPGFIRKF